MHENRELEENIIINKSDEIEGFGGWLIIFQLKIFLSLMIMIAAFLDGFTLLSHVYIAQLILYLLVLLFFYQHKISFRIIYLATALFGSVMLIIDGSYLQFSLDFIIETIFIIALFRSKRVQSTFI